MSLWYDKKAYTLLKKCSDNQDMTEWNTYREETNHAPVNLRFANLKSFYLIDADLRNVDLRGAVLNRIKCKGADVENANISTSSYFKIYFVTLFVLLLFTVGLFKLGINTKIISIGILLCINVIFINIFTRNLRNSFFDFINIMPIIMFGLISLIGFVSNDVDTEFVGGLLTLSIFIIWILSDDYNNVDSMSLYVCKKSRKSYRI